MPSLAQPEKRSLCFSTQGVSVHAAPIGNLKKAAARLDSDFLQELHLPLPFVAVASLRCSGDVWRAAGKLSGRILPVMARYVCLWVLPHRAAEPKSVRPVRGFEPLHAPLQGQLYRTELHRPYCPEKMKGQSPHSSPPSSTIHLPAAASTAPGRRKGLPTAPRKGGGAYRPFVPPCGREKVTTDPSAVAQPSAVSRIG